VKLVDKHRIFSLKAKYDPTTRLAEVKTRIRRRVKTRFVIDPDHIYQEIRGFKGRKRTNVVYVDNAKRESVQIERVREIIEDDVKRTEKTKEQVEAPKSVSIHSNEPIDQKKRNKLDYLLEAKFWKSLIEKRRLPLSTLLICLFAGAGMYHVFLLIVRMFGFEV